MAERKLTVVLAGDSKGLDRAMSKASASASGFGSKLGGIAKTAGLALGGLAVGAVAVGKGFLDAAVESQKVTKQTEAVIKSMGGAANVTSSQVAKLSEKLSMQSGVDDELIQSGSNVLLTFGNLRNAVGDGPKVFDRATQAALDMSVALGTDMTSASMMVGKALNDPVKGLSKLARSGVQFTKQQEDQIKAMVKAGDTAGAQAIMLKELERQFGGSAAAQATAGDKLKVVWGNLQEQLGAKLLPIAEKVATFLANNLPKALEAVGRVLGPIGKQIGMFWNALTTGFTEDEGTRIEMIALQIRDGFQKLASFITDKALPALKGIGEWILEHKPVLLGLAAAIGTGLVAAFVAWATAATAAAVATIAAHAPLIALGVAIGALVAGIIYAYENWGWFRTAVDAVARFITGTLWPVLQNLARFFTNTLVPAVRTAIDFVRNNWKLLLGILTGPIGTAVYIITTHWNTIKAGATAVKDWVVARFNEMVGFFQGLPHRIGELVSRAWNAMKNGLRAAVDWIVGQIDRMLGPLDEAIGGLGKIKGFVGGGGISDDFIVRAVREQRAAGGPVGAGRSYLVGERGPEILTMGANGFVTPNHMLGGGGGLVINLDLRGAVGVDGPAVERWVRNLLTGDVRRNGGIPGTNIVKATA